MRLLSACFILRILLGCCSCVAIPEFHQDDYDIVHDRLELRDYNKVFVSTAYGRISNYNVSQPIKVISFGGTLIKEVRSAFYMNIYFLKDVNGIYRSLPFNFTFEFCDEFAHLGRSNPFGIKTAIELSNFRGCPMSKQDYHLNDWILEQDKFPPHLPAGRYSINVFSWVDNGEFFFTLFGLVKLYLKRQERKSTKENK